MEGRARGGASLSSELGQGIGMGVEGIGKETGGRELVQQRRLVAAGAAYLALEDQIAGWRIRSIEVWRQHNHTTTL